MFITTIITIITIRGLRGLRVPGIRVFLMVLLDVRGWGHRGLGVLDLFWGASTWGQCMQSAGFRFFEIRDKLSTGRTSQSLTTPSKSTPQTKVPKSLCSGQISRVAGALTHEFVVSFGHFAQARDTAFVSCPR